MLTGFGGHLVSEAFVEQALLAAAGGGQPVDRFREELIAWRRSLATLGPASSLRTLLDVGAAPLTGALGFEAPTDLELTAEHAAATLRYDGGRTALLVTMWAAPLDSCWRAGVTEALDRSASWCFLFNGTHLRIVDAGRLYARRFVEFDLERAC